MAQELANWGPRVFPGTSIVGTGMIGRMRLRRHQAEEQQPESGAARAQAAPTQPAAVNTLTQTAAQFWSLTYAATGPAGHIFLGRHACDARRFPMPGKSTRLKQLVSADDERCRRGRRSRAWGFPSDARGNLKISRTK